MSIMHPLVNASKRILRIASAPIPMSTKAGLIRAEFARGGTDVTIRVGPSEVYVAAATCRIDYYTLYGALIDQHFSWSVADSAVLDIGAHKGYYAARSLAHGAIRVDSYEPGSQNLSYLNRSAERHQKWRVQAAAVGAEAGTVDLYLSADSWSHSIHEPQNGSSVGTEQVRLFPLTEALREISADGLPVVAKINVEGAAGPMIVGTKSEEWKSVVSLSVDVEPSDTVGPEAIAEYLATCGLLLDRESGRRLLFTRVMPTG